MVKKTLYRSKSNKVIAGVCGGIGEYLDIDPTVIRLLWVLITIPWGFGVNVHNP
jgi:phage shock protein C